MVEESFEARIKRLEDIVDTMQRGQAGLEESVVLFDEGIKLIASLEKELSSAKEKVQLLIAKTQEPVLKDFD
ncbi:MAG: exodeoxyribonuclease VII small subunit [Eubacteriaceae bacterium]|nr:exodeoxyribonuclease VII small subunit [Eubacteriaceae bacterium]